MGEPFNNVKVLVETIEPFNGTSSRYERWAAKTLTAFNLYCPAISAIIKRGNRPADSSRGLGQDSAGGQSTPTARQTNVVDATSPQEETLVIGDRTFKTSLFRGTTPAGRTETRVQKAKRMRELADAVVAAAEAAEKAEKEGDDDSADVDTTQTETSAEGRSSRTETSVPPPTALTLPVRRTQEQIDWDNTNERLYSVLFLCTKGAAASLVKRFRPRHDQQGDGLKVWVALKEKYQPNSAQRCRALINDLNNLTMQEGTDPEVFITDAWDLKYQLEDLGEPVTETRLADIILHGLPPSYDILRAQLAMLPSADLSVIEHTAKNLFLNRSRQASGRQQRPEPALALAATHTTHGTVARVTCYHCGQPGHKANVCPTKVTSGHRTGRSRAPGTSTRVRQQAATGGRREVKWCQLHNTPHHSNEECRAQQVGHQQVGHQPASDGRTSAGGHPRRRSASQRSAGDTSHPARRTSQPRQQHASTSIAVQPPLPASAGPSAVTQLAPYTSPAEVHLPVPLPTPAEELPVVSGPGLALAAVGRPRTLSSSTDPAPYMSSASGSSLPSQEYSYATTTSLDFASEVPKDPHYSTLAMLMDSGATSHFIDPNLITGCYSLVKTITPLVPPHVIITTGDHRLCGREQGQLPVLVRDFHGQLHQVSLSVILVPGLGRHLFSTGAAKRRGVSTVFAATDYMAVGDLRIPLRTERTLAFVDWLLPADCNIRNSSADPPWLAAAHDSLVQVGEPLPSGVSTPDLLEDDSADGPTAVDSTAVVGVECEGPIAPDGRDRVLRSAGPSDPVRCPNNFSSGQRRALNQLALSVTPTPADPTPLVPPASILTPNPARQVVLSPHQAERKLALERELRSLEEHHLADKVLASSLPAGAAPIGPRWVFRVKPG